MPRDSVRKAQAAAKTYLEMRGYEIIEQNWHQSRFKVDIIAKKADVLYFVEVRYRANDDQTNGLDAVSASKLKQIRQAAQSWVEEYKWQGTYMLSSIEMAGPSYAVIGFIDNEF